MRSSFVRPYAGPFPKPLDYGEEPRTIQIHIEEREPRFSDNSQLHRFLRRAGAYSGNVQVRKAVNKCTVKFFNGQRGYGFIAPEGGGNDVFVHATALERAGIRGLVDGQSVSYDTEQDRRTGKLALKNITDD